jgi:tetratricopeptide (TPR) repeat protein
MHWITVVGVALIAIGTIITFIGQNESNKQNSMKLEVEIEQLSQGNRQLIDQNKQLLSKVDQYQKDLREKEDKIEELEIKAKKTERGITSSYDFNGAKRVTTRPGHIQLDIGSEVNVFQSMQALIQQHNYSDLVPICEKQIKETPEWLTPYFYLGIASADLGNKVKAIELFEYVVKNAPDDPAYSQANEFLKRLKDQ